jgi:hypothetical protein
MEGILIILLAVALNAYIVYLCITGRETLKKKESRFRKEREKYLSHLVEDLGMKEWEAVEQYGSITSFQELLDHNKRLGLLKKKHKL